ncbi:hypothetical protein CHUAL_014260 [Chamberlinius hualienensis]
MIFKLQLFLALILIRFIDIWTEPCRKVSSCHPEVGRRYIYLHNRAKNACGYQMLHSQCYHYILNLTTEIMKLEAIQNLDSCDECNSLDKNDISICEKIVHESVIFCLRTWRNETTF